MSHKTLHITLSILFLICLNIIVYSQSVEGEYDSPLIKTLGDVIKFENGDILQSVDNKQSWQKIGSYFDNGKNISINLARGSTLRKQLKIKAEATIFGLKMLGSDRAKLNVDSNYAFIRSIFD